MFIIKKMENKKFLTWLLGGAAIFCVLIYAFLLAWLYFESIYENRIYPGIKINSLGLSGKTAEEAREEISKKINEIYFEGIYFEYKDKKVKLDPIVSSSEGEWSYQVIDFDIDNTVSSALNFGRKNNFAIDLKNKIKTYFQPTNIYAIHEINQDYFKNFLSENFNEFELPAQNARLIATTTETGEIKFKVEKEKMGIVIDYEGAFKKLEKELALLNSASINLTTISNYPEIKKENCLNVEQKAKNILALSPYYLKGEEKEWKIEQEIILEWLTLEKKEENEISVEFDKEKIEEYLTENIAAKIDIKPIDARFEIKNDRVTEFQASRDGYQVNIASSAKKIIDDFIFQKATSTELIFTITKSSLKTNETNDLGIKEIIGMGHSNFAGSPANRRHNIKIGANSLWGIIIKPDEEFSLVKNLGPINASTGYLPELVIKDNKTIPEYGGGLCQIATTLFRAAIQSGLPITERRNHSYRVSYYEPAGMDASVYIPNPDVKFINDTGNNILIQYRIIGNDLYFDFWGTKDGRLVEVSDPVIYNLVKPGPTKFIETEDLKPGEKKCTERAHTGADAYFDYKITYPDGTIKERRFTSHYVPWREVCLIGKKESKEDVEKELGEEETAKEESKEEIKNEREAEEMEISL